MVVGTVNIIWSESMAFISFVYVAFGSFVTM